MSEASQIEMSLAPQMRKKTISGASRHQSGRPERTTTPRENPAKGVQRPRNRKGGTKSTRWVRPAQKRRKSGQTHPPLILYQRPITFAVHTDAKGP